MKKTLFIAFVTMLTILASCSSTPEEKLASEKEVYTEKGEKFIEAFIQDTDEDQEVTGFKIIKIDSITDLTEIQAAEAQLRKLDIEYNHKLEYAKDLMDIDMKYGGELSTMTVAAIDEAKELEDELNDGMEKARKLSKKVVGKSVYYKINFEMADGTNNKDIPFVLHFDLDKDLPSKWNDLK